jgi:hypothetical protein
VITVPKQTPLSAGIAYAEGAKKSFEPLERLLERDSILNHYLVRISHDASEAILATVEEQKIDLLITDFEAFRSSKKIQTILTCDVLGILAGGGDDFLFNSIEKNRFESESSATNAQNQLSKKNLVVLYDGGDHSDIVLKTTSWLEHSGLFKINVLYVNTKGEENKKPEILQDVMKQKEYLQQSGVEFNEIIIPDDTLNDTTKSSDIIESALNSAQPDLLIVGATVSKFSFLTDTQFINLLYQFKCPVIVARHFSIPGVHKLKSFIVKILRLSS